MIKIFLKKNILLWLGAIQITWHSLHMWQPKHQLIYRWSLRSLRRPNDQNSSKDFLFQPKCLIAQFEVIIISFHNTFSLRIYKPPEQLVPTTKQTYISSQRPVWCLNESKDFFQAYKLVYFAKWLVFTR